MRTSLPSETQNTQIQTLMPSETLRIQIQILLPSEILQPKFERRWHCRWHEPAGPDAEDAAEEFGGECSRRRPHVCREAGLSRSHLQHVRLLGHV